MRIILFFILYFAVGGYGFPTFPYKIVDLARNLDENEPYWPTLAGYEKIVELFGNGPNGVWIAANKLKTTEHIGTHLDAPHHFHEHSWQMQQIPLDHLIGPGVIVDVKAKVANNPDYRLRQSDLEAWENNYGKIPDGAIVIMNSGWHDKHPDKKLIWGSQDPLNTSSFHYPGWHEDAVAWLASHRSIHIIGVDSPSLDYGQSTTFPVHVLSSKENICGLENVAYLDKIPPSGSIISAAAVKNVGGTGFPTRVYAMIPEDGAFSNSSVKTQLMFLCMLISSVSTLILVY